MILPLCNMNTIHITQDFLRQPLLVINSTFNNVLNLIKNSIEAMPNGGTLNISSSINNSKVEIRIEDSGVGMSQEQIHRFGEPYFSTKQKEPV